MCLIVSELGPAPGCSGTVPVRQEGTDEVLGIIGDVAVIGEGQRVFVVHYFAVGADQRVCVKRRVA